jgi:hypothetical protein
MDGRFRDEWEIEKADGVVEGCVMLCGIARGSWALACQTLSHKSSLLHFSLSFSKRGAKPLRRIAPRSTFLVSLVPPSVPLPLLSLLLSPLAPSSLHHPRYDSHVTAAAASQSGARDQPFPCCRPPISLSLSPGRFSNARGTSQHGDTPPFYTIRSPLTSLWPAPAFSDASLHLFGASMCIDRPPPSILPTRSPTLHQFADSRCQAVLKFLRFLSKGKT